MKLIDADELIKYIKTEGIYCDTEADKRATIKKINTLFPTIDAVEVVMCKECRKHGMSNCYMWGDVTTDDWMWCCDGERSSNEND